MHCRRAELTQFSHLLPSAGLGLTGVIAAAVHFGGPLLLESGSWEGLQLGDGGSLGAGDLLGGLLWRWGHLPHCS